MRRALRTGTICSAATARTCSQAAGSWSGASAPGPAPAPSLFDAIEGYRRWVAATDTPLTGGPLTWIEDRHRAVVRGWWLCAGEVEWRVSRVPARAWRVCQDSSMELAASKSGVPAVGVGILGQADGEILSIARKFVRRAGSSEPVLLAMATGRVVSRDLRVPRLNLSPRFVVTPRRWWIVDKEGTTSYAHGAVRDIVGVFTATDGLTVALSEKKSARFLIGRMYADRAKVLVDGLLAHARLCASPFDNIAPGQRPLMLVGTHVGGRGTELESGEECVVAISGRGICATGFGSVFLKAASSLRAIQVGGLGAYPTGGGWVGGGFGMGGVLEGAALAGLMNTLVARRHVDCLVRFVFDDAEATFSLTGEIPQRLQLDTAPLLAALRGPSPVPNAEALNPTTVAQHEPAPGVWTELSDQTAGNFCGFCGARRSSNHVYCTSCGNPYSTSDRI
jgi:hypothetical protein